MGGMVKKWEIAPFLNKGTAQSPSWFRIKKSTALDLLMNPETKEYDYIADESPTTELDKYKPSLSQALTMYKGEEDYEYVFDKFFNMSVGEDAKTEILLVFFQEPVDESLAPTHFKAWKSGCVISVNDLNGVDSVLNFDVTFGGTVAKGYVTVTEGVPSFTEGTYSAS